MSLVLSKGGEIKRRQVRADIGIRRFFGDTLDLSRRRRADRSRARSRRRALRSRRAFHIRAARARARRALTTLLLTGTVVNDDGLRLGNTALQDVLAEVGCGRALSLQHVLAHIGALRARRNCTFQDIFAKVGLAARRADWARICSARARARLFTGLAARNNGSRLESFFFYHLFRRLFHIATRNISKTKN